jgi:DNA-directed RNA polymerase specialized sigma24 family protein
LDYNPAVSSNESHVKAGVIALSPAELPSAPQSREQASDSPGKGSRVKWTLTREAFDKLLEQFSPDRQEAARQYEMMRAKLLRFFEWRSSPSPEQQVDETVDRVAKKIEEGTIISNLDGYFHEARHYIFFESIKPRQFVALDDIPERAAEPLAEDDQKETRLGCLDVCLDKLSPEARKLILNYYFEAKRAKIDHRRQLAQESSLNALRIRACRIRKGLEKCVKDCVAQKI